MSKPWEAIAKRKKEEQAAKIPQEWLLSPKYLSNPQNVLHVPRSCGILTQQEVDITENYDATQLAEEIRTRRLKSVDIVKAFSKRAAIAHQLTNCLTEIFFDEGLARAAELDDHLAAGNPPLGPLHGVPISLKDTFKVPGHDASIGIAELAFRPCTTASTLVEILLGAGAVLYCKTNVPQTLMALDSHNNVFGRTINPLNSRLTAGGSSGGEGALIAMRGSILGVGTDVGGSIRIPAMCNGLYGIKPSSQRVPYAGQESGQLPASEKLSLVASAGPLSASLRDCGLFLKAVAGQKPWELDPSVVPGNWDEMGSVQQDSITIGIVRRDGVIDPLPPIDTILAEVGAKLRTKGIKVVELDITPIFSKCQSLANALFGVEGGNTMFNLLEKTGEPLSPWLSTRLKRKNPKTFEQIRHLHAQRAELEKEALGMWRDAEGHTIDAIICPVAPHPIPPIDRWNGVSYTSSFVLLDYPAGTIPVRPFQPTDTEGDLPSTAPISSWDKVNRKLWTGVDRSIYIGTPLCVQVVVPKLQEKRLYEAMCVINEILKDDYSRTYSIEPRL